MKIFNFIFMQVFGLGLLLILPGCFKQYVHVSSNTFSSRKKIPRGFSTGSSFYIVPPKKSNQLLVQEVLDKIIDYLESEGRNYSVSYNDNADYYLVFDFDVTSEKHMVNKSIYVPSQITTTYGTNRSSDDDYVVGFDKKKSDYKEEAFSSGTLVPVSTEVVVFTHNLTVTVYDGSKYRNTSDEEQVWLGTTEMSKDHGDIRVVIDYLLKSAFKNFGKDTSRMIKDVWIKEPEKHQRRW